MKHTIPDGWLALTERLDGVGDWLAPLGLRLLLAWEYWEAGIGKYRGENWFGNIQSNFPVPFNMVPPGISWSIATWFELAGAIALLLGFGTRFFAFSLLILTMVAMASVHWPMDWNTLHDLAMGYAIRDTGFGNFKLPLIFTVMLLPLVFHGAGKFSLDALASSYFGTAGRQANGDLLAWGLGLLVLGVPLALLLPTLGLAITAAGAAMALLSALLGAK